MAMRGTPQVRSELFAKREERKRLEDALALVQQQIITLKHELARHTASSGQAVFIEDLPPQPAPKHLIEQDTVEAEIILEPPAQQLKKGRRKKA